MSVLLLIAVIAVLIYYVSLRVHPMTRCKRCNRSRHYDLVYTDRARHACPECHGTGRQERLGVRLFLGPR